MGFIRKVKEKLFEFRDWLWPISNKDMTRRKLFYVFMKLFIFGFLVIGVGGILGIYLSDTGDKVFKAVALGIVILGICIFIGFFIWAVYFYHVSHGLTDEEVSRIDNELVNRNSPGDPSDVLRRKTENPYADESFGLPRGTVRGTIAFTLLFGAIAMLILSMSMDPELEENAFFWDHYEFYKTAFIMMIAFYFGSRSLEYLQKRWPSVRQGSGDSKRGEQQGESPKTFEEDISNKIDTSTEISTAPSPTGLKRILQVSELEEVQELGKVKMAEHITMLEYDYPQIRDNRFKKYLTEDMIESVAIEHDLDKNILKAVIKVESAGSGFLSDGRPKILFEGHKFWEHLSNTISPKKDPNQLLDGNEDILYREWTPKYYLGGDREYERLNKARNINPEAAYYSTSWGLFQIMGENFNNGLLPRWKGKNLQDFIDAQYESEYQHLLDFMEFISTKEIKDKKGENRFLISYLKKEIAEEEIEWEGFAYGYNGSGYKKNNYDVRLKRAYEQFKDSGEIYA